MTLIEWGWGPFFEAQVELPLPEPLQPARIVAVYQSTLELRGARASWPAAIAGRLLRPKTPEEQRPAVDRKSVV